MKNVDVLNISYKKSLYWFIPIQGFFVVVYQVILNNIKDGINQLVFCNLSNRYPYIRLNQQQFRGIR